MSYRVFKLICLCLTILFVTGCQTTVKKVSQFLCFEKTDPEMWCDCNDPNQRPLFWPLPCKSKTPKYDYEFSPTKEKNVSKPDQNDLLYLNLDYLRFHRSVSGHWQEYPSWSTLFGTEKLLWIFGPGDRDSELVLFVALVTYNREDDYSRIQKLFENPLKIDTVKIKNNKHDWFSANFDLKNLPKDKDGTYTASGHYWLGYNGAVKAYEPNDSNHPSDSNALFLGDFKAKEGSRKNGLLLWPIEITPREYVYLKIMVLEETGHSRLRKLTKSLENKDSEFELVLRAILEEKPLKVAQIVARGFAAGILKDKLKKDGLIDLEYFYESKKSTKDIPLLHLRKRLKNDNPSLELKLSSTLEWRPPEIRKNEIWDHMKRCE